MNRSLPLLRLFPMVLGLLGLLAFIILGVYTGQFLTWHFMLGGLSILSIFISVLWMNDVRWRDTLASFAYSLFVVLCAAMIYLLSANRPIRFDLTQDKVHSLSSQTQAVLRRIPPQDRVLVTIFAPVQEHQSLGRFFQSYERLSPQVKFELYDPARDIDVVQQYGGRVEKNQMYVQLVDSEGRIVRRSDGRLSTGDSLRENTLTNAIARVVQEGQQAIYWSEGYGERRLDDEPQSLTKVAQLTAEATLPFRPLRLAEGRIPDDAAMIIIASPIVDISDFDLELLKNYLDEGGKLFLLLDPMANRNQPLPNFDALLAHIGVNSPNAFVVDPQAVNNSSIAFAPRTVWVKHPITQATNRAPFTMQGARPFRSEGEIDKSLRLEAIIATNEQSWSEPGNQLRSARRLVPPNDPAEVDRQVLAMTVSKDTSGGRFGRTMRVVLAGDSDAFSNAFVENNGDASTFFLQSVNWLRERQDLLTIPPRMLTSTPVVLTKTTLWALFGGFTLAGLLITVGGTTWALARRRNK